MSDGLWVVLMVWDCLRSPCGHLKLVGAGPGAASPSLWAEKAAGGGAYTAHKGWICSGK